MPPYCNSIRFTYLHCMIDHITSLNGTTCHGMAWYDQTWHDMTRVTRQGAARQGGRHSRRHSRSCRRNRRRRRMRQENTTAFQQIRSASNVWANVGRSYLVISPRYCGQLKVITCIPANKTFDQIQFFRDWEASLRANWTSIPTNGYVIMQ